MTPRTKPMPTPVPEWLKDVVCRECNGDAETNFKTQDFPWFKGSLTYTMARLLWKMGEPEPVDPDLLIAREAVRIAGDAFQRTPEKYALAAIKLYKAEKERT